MNDDDLEILHQRVDEYPDSLDGYFDRMFKSTGKVYRQQMGRLLLAAIDGNGSLPLRVLDDFKTELNDSDYDLWLPVDQAQRTSQDEARQVARARKLLDARCRDLLEVVNERIQSLHRTVRDFLATSYMYNLLYDRAGPSFMPVVSLSKVSLAMIKTSRCHDRSIERLPTLLSYELKTASKSWPLHIQFLENLMAPAAFWLRRASQGFERPRDPLEPRQSREKNGIMFAGSIEDSSNFLDVSNTQDCLISVEEDLTTKFGVAGHSFDHSAVPIKGFYWIGVKAAAWLDRIALIKGDKIYAFVARFREEEDGLPERQRAFIRIAQAIFAQPGVFDDLIINSAHLQIQYMCPDTYRQK